MNTEERVSLELALRNAVLAGDEAAWRALYERCFDPLYVYVHRRCGLDRQRTEEVLQECWMTAVRRVRTFHPARGTFENWLRGIAENVLRNQWRRWRRDRRLQRLELGDPRIEEAAAAGISSGDGVELAEQIAMAMAALPTRYQAVLRAKYEQELSVAEIAARWNEKPKGIESLLSRARESFRSAYRRLEDQT